MKDVIKVLKKGDKFRASNVLVGEFTFYTIIQANEEAEPWIVAFNGDEPYVMQEVDIDDEKIITEVRVVAPGKPEVAFKTKKAKKGNK